ncbi:MAG: hypothetical protein Q9182_006770 [Xanthomendoza sp. 2 TL-2023]
MWNRILGKSSEVQRKSSISEHHGKSDDAQRSTPSRSESLKSTIASHQAPRNEGHHRGFNPTSTSYSSTTQNQYPGTASASIASSYATAFNDPTNHPDPSPGLIRNASLADQVANSSAGHGSRPAVLDSGSEKEKGKEKGDPEAMEDKRARRERRLARERDDDRRGTKGRRDNKRRNSEKGKERAIGTDEAAYVNPQKKNDSIHATSTGLNGSSSFVPLAGLHNDHGSGYMDDQPHAQSSHVPDQFPGQFPAQSAAPYRPPLAASEGGPGLAAEYYGDAGQSVVHQPGVRTQSPSLIVGAEPHLQAASAVAAPPLEPSASGGIGAAASFFNSTFSAGADVEGHQSQKPNPNTPSAISQYNSAAPPTSTYTGSGERPTSLGSPSAPVIPTLGAVSAGAAAGYYSSNHGSKPVRPDQASSRISGDGQFTGSSNHHDHSETHGSYTSRPSSSRPSSKPGKHSSQSSNAPLYAAGAAGLAAAASHHNHHSATGHSSHGEHYNYNGGFMAQKHRHRHQGPFSQLVNFFKDPEGVAQFEEYTEYIGVCRHCFDPHSSPRDAPRRHHYRHRRSNERVGSSVRVDKGSRYSSSENESRRKKNKSWLEAGIAGYGLAKMGESLFRSDSDSHDSDGPRDSKVSKSRRRTRSSSSERKSRTSYGVVNTQSDVLSQKSRSHGRLESGITADGKLYRKDARGHLNTSTVKTHDSRRHSRSRSRDRRSSIANLGLGAAVGSGVIASNFHRRSRSPKKVLVRSKYGDKESTSELASVLRLNESDPRDSRHHSPHSPDSIHRTSRRSEKKGRTFFTFSNGSSTSSASSNLAVEPGHERKAARSTKTKKKKKDKDSRDAEAALLGLGAAALAFNQLQRPKRKGELIAVKESRGKHKIDKVGVKGKRPSSSSEEGQWESASDGDYSSADSELAYGASLHRRSQESLSSDSSGLDKWSWRWGSKKQPKQAPRDRRQSSGFDNVGAVAATAAMMTGAMTGAHRTTSSVKDQESRMTSTSSVPLQHVHPMPTSDPTRFDVARHDSGVASYQPLMNARPDPVPIQHPQPIASVPPAVYTTQAPYSHSYSAPSGPPQTSGYPHQTFPIDNRSTIVEEPHKDLPGAFPTGNEYFQSFTSGSKKESNFRRRDSSPVLHASEFAPSSAGSRRRRSLKDDASSVRFDLTKEQEDKDRRDERRQRKEEDQRRERLERREPEGRKAAKLDSPSKWDIAVTESSTASVLGSLERPTDKKKESWAVPAAAGVIAAAIGTTVAADSSSKDRPKITKRRDSEERDIEVIIKDRPVASESTAGNDGRGRPLQEKPMSVWQAAAKVRRSSSHTEYAAYFAPTELLSKSAGVKETAGGANADNDVTAFHAPNMITIEPSEPRGVSPSRAYSFPISAEDLEPAKKPLPWAVPRLNLVEATPPTSRDGSVVGSRSPRSGSPLKGEVPEIPLEPLESVVTPGPNADQPTRVEYTVIEPKDHGIALADSPVSDTSIPKAVPGISSLRKKPKERKKSPPEACYGDDLDFAATVAAGLQDTGFNPSIVVDDPSFHRRDSPPGSENVDYRGRPTSGVGETTTEMNSPRSPPHGSVEEIPERHIPGSFEEVEELETEPRLRNDDVRKAKKGSDRERALEELTGPSDNADVKPNVYSTEKDAFKPEDITNAAVDPVGDRPYPQHDKAIKKAAISDTTEPSDNAGVKPNVYSTELDAFEPEDITNAAIDPVKGRPHNRWNYKNGEAASDDRTEPADNAQIKPHVYTAEPESFGPENIGNMTIDPVLGGQGSVSIFDPSARSPPITELTDDRSGTADILSDEAPSVAATAVLPSGSRKDSKSSKKSKRRSVGFDDNTSVISSPPAHRGTQDSGSSSRQSRKGGIFGLFSKSSDNPSEPRGMQQIPVEASLEDFEEPRERRRKSKSRKAGLDDDEPSAVTLESVASGQADTQDDWDAPKKSKRGKEKRRSSGDPGRITQDLPAQVIAPASPGHDPIPTSDGVLTYLEDQEPGRSQKHPFPDQAFDEIVEPSRAHDNQQPSFLGERPKQPPLPDIPDASEDPGGQPTVERRTLSEQNLPSLEQRRGSLVMADNNPQRPLPDLHSDGRSVSYSSPSLTAIPLRPLRFGRRPSSPGVARSLPSTPQPSTTTPELPMTPRRRERPHSTEFKSNEFRPMWLLEKYGSRQEPFSQENYPSLPSSHSTSRASSIHESDNFHQTEALDLAMDTRNYQRRMQEPHGLSIDTGHRENEPELLDSQQTTPKAATFHTTISNGDGNSKERKSPPVIEEPKPEINDVTPSPSAHIVPLNEVDQDQRLLHGIEDLFPQRRASSPSRYDTGLGSETSVKSRYRGSSSPLSSIRGKEGIMSMTKDAALGTFIGGPAAALLKSTSQHDEYQEQLSNKSSIAEPSKEEIESMPKPADILQGRPTAAENRLMQEQDTQDAVDSWFTPSQSKISRQARRERKRGKSYEGAQSTSPTDLSDQIKEAGTKRPLQSIPDAESRLILDDAVMTPEPTESIVLPQFEATVDKQKTPVVDTNYQAALTSRRDSKGKKKKSKKRTSDSLEDPNAEPAELTTEQMIGLEEALKRIMDEPSNLSANIGPSPEDRTPSILAEPFRSTEKIEKGKEMDWSLPLAAPVFEQPQGKVSAAEPAEAADAEDFRVTNERSIVSTFTERRKGERDRSVSDEVPYEFPVSEEAKRDMSTETVRSLEEPDVPVIPDVRESEGTDLISEEVPYKVQAPEQAETQLPTDPPYLMEQPGFSINTDVRESERNGPISEEIPYQFTAPEESETDLPYNLLHSAVQPSSGDGMAEPESSISANNTPLDELSDDRTLEATTAPSVAFRTPDEVIPSSRAFKQTALGSQLSPEAIQLPPDDDLDLFEALPQSPVLQAVDAPAIDQEGILGTHDAAITEPKESKTVQDQALEPSNNPSVVLSKAISELTLPESAAAAQAVKTAEAPTDDGFIAFPAKDAEKERRRKKNKAPEAPAFEIGSPIEISSSNRLASGLEEAKEDPFFGERATSIPASMPSADVGGMLGENYEMPQDQPADDWLDSTTTTGKEKEFRKGKSTGPETEHHTSDLSVPVTKSTLFQDEEVKDISVQGKESSTAAHQLPGDRGIAIDQAASSPNEPKSIYSVEEPLARRVEEDELPRTKKKKTKKSKKVQFDDLEEAQSPESREAAVPDTPLATTSTATEVVALLHSRNLQQSELSTEHKDRSVEPFEEPTVLANEQLTSRGMTLSENIPQDSDETRIVEVAATVPFIPESPVESIEAHQIGQGDRSISRESDGPFTAAAIASTETAAAVQGILSEVEEPDGEPAAGHRPIVDPKQATDVDEFTWAPYKRKKKGKKSTPVKDAVSVDTPEAGSLDIQGVTKDGAPISGAIPEHDPVEEFPIKKSRKDRKNKRQGLSRSASDFEKENVDDDIPPNFEHPVRKEALASTGDAPSILERTDKLPSINMSKCPEAAQRTIPYDIPALPESGIASRGPDSQRVAGDGELAPRHVSEEGLASANEALIIPDVEEMEVSADVPSILEKQVELPGIERPVSQDPILPISSVTVSEAPAVAGDISSPRVGLKDTQPTEEASAFNETFAPTMTKDQLSATISEERPQKVVEYSGHVSDENQGPVPGPTLETFPKRKKDRKSLKKARATDGTEERVVRDPDDQGETAQLAPKELREDMAAAGVEEPSLPIAQVAIDQPQTPALSKKEKRKSKNSRALGWEDDTPVQITEPPKAISEEQEVVTNSGVEQSARPAVQNDSAIAAETVPEAKEDKKAQKAKASATDYEILVESTETLEPSPEVVDAELERSLEPTVIETPVVAEALPKSRKDKKKSKKSKVLGWEDDALNGETDTVRFEPTALPQQDVDISTSGGIPLKSPEQPAEELADQHSTSQKRDVAFAEYEPTMGAGKKSQLEAVAPAETETVGDLPGGTAEPPSVEGRAFADHQPTLEESKRRGTKPKVMEFEGELSVTPLKDGVDLEELTPLRVEVVAGQPMDDQGPTEVEEVVISPDEHLSIEKGKRNGRESKLVAFDEESLVRPPTSEKGQPALQPLDSEALSEPQGPIQESAVVGEAPGANEQPSLEEGTKKGTEPEFVDSHNRPSVSSVHDETDPDSTIAALGIIQISPNIQPGDEDGFEDREFMTPLPESMEDEENAKQAKGVSWEGESAPAIVKSPVPDASNLPSHLVDTSIEPAPQFNVETIGAIEKDISANEIGKKPAMAATERESLQTELLNASGITDTATNTGDSRPDTTKDAFIDERNLSVAGPDTLSESRFRETANHPSAPPSDMIARNNDNSSKLGDDGIDQSQLSVLPHRDHQTEHIDLPTTDFPKRNSSPLLIQADHVQIDPVPAFQVAEANIPATPPNETMVDQTPVVKAVTSEPTNPIITPIAIATENVVSAETETSKPPNALIAEELDLPAVESDPVPDAGPVDITEARPPVSKHNKKKAKKGKNDMAWEDEVTTSSQAEKPAYNEMVPALDMLAEQHSVLPTTPSEQTPEDVPPVSRKDKKKSRKKNKALLSDDDPSESTAPKEPDNEADVRNRVVEEAPLTPGQSIPEQIDESQFSSKKDKKKAKNKKQVFALSDERSESITPADLDAQADLVGQTMEEPSLPAEPTVVEMADELPSSKKKKKSKKSGKAFALDEEPLVSRKSLETGLGIPNVDQTQTEPPTPAFHDVTENLDDFVSLGKKGKKPKKSKKNYSFVDEPFEHTSPSEPGPREKIQSAQTGEPSLQVSRLGFADESPLVIEKKETKSKKSKEAIDSERDISEVVTPAEPDLGLEKASLDQLAEESPLTAEASIAEAANDNPSGKKETEFSKKNEKAIGFENKPLETTIPVEPGSEKGFSYPPTEELSLPAGPSLAEGSDNFALLAAANEMRSRKSKGLSALTDEPLQSLTPTEGSLKEDTLLEQRSVPMEGIATEPKKEFSKTSGKGDESEKSSRTHAYGDEISEIAAPAVPDSERDVLFDEPRVPTEATMVEAEAFPTLDKGQKQSKRDKEASVFDEEPSKITMPIEVSDQPTKELPLPADPSTAEDIQNSVLMSRKDRKKVKKDKKTVGFDDNSLENDQPKETAMLAEETAGDGLYEFASLSKKDKKKARKATKALARADENPETASFGEVVPLDDQPQEQSSVVPSEPQSEKSQEKPNSRPRDILPELPAYSHLTPEERLKDAAPSLDTTPAISQAAGERALIPEADDFENFAGSKKSKKDKRSKKAQAFSWGGGEPIVETRPPDTETSAEVTVTPLQQIQEGQVLEEVAEQAGPAAATPNISEIEHVPTIESAVSPAFVEQQLAPRHQDPASLAPTDTAPPFAISQHPPPVTTSEHQRDLDLGPIAEQQNIQSADSAGEPTKVATQAPAHASIADHDDDEYGSFAPTKKSKKSQKSKKEATKWEDAVIPSPELVQESNRAVDDIDDHSRPEIIASPTESRSNQAPATLAMQDDASYSANIINDPVPADDGLSDDEPLGPAPVEDNRSDYFGLSTSRDARNPPQPLENNKHPDLAAQSTQADAGSAMLNKDVQQAIAAEERIPQAANATEEPVLQGATAGATDDSESFTPAKKGKKSKRKKKQAVDDVMWEFPPMTPAQTGESTPIDSKWPSDPSRGDRLYIPPSNLSAKEKKDLAEEELVRGAEPSRVVSPDQPPVDSHVQAGIQGGTTLTAGPRTGEAAEDDLGTFSRQSKKGKRSKKSRAAEPAEELLADTPQDNYLQERVEDQPRANKTSAGLYGGAAEAIDHAAAVGAGMTTTLELGRESLTKEQGQQADTSIKPEQDSHPTRRRTSDDDAGLRRTPTPERHSPIQAWHQNISMSQSPKRSELYEVEPNRPRSATSTRRKRSNDGNRRQSVTPERRSPIEAWHQYNSPRHSPPQSELYDFNEKTSTRSPDHPATTAINRDSAVHVSDSPVVSQQSPVRRVMRDSGYPDTEASPVVDRGSEVPNESEVAAQVFEQDDGRESTRTYPLGMPAEDYADYNTSQGQGGERTRARSNSGQETYHEELELPPRHPIQPSQSSEDLCEPSPVSSTTKDRSSALFDSSPSTRQGQGHQEQQRPAQEPGPPRLHESGYNDGERDSGAADRSLTPDREDNSAMVIARAESLAALSGIRGPSQEQQRPSLFGGPLGISSDGTSPETPIDQEGVNRRRLNTITEYSPEESPLHKKNRDLSDVGVSAHGIKAARRSGTPLAISKRRASSPQADSGKGVVSPEDATPRPFWPPAEDDPQPMDVEGSRNRGMEQRPSGQQSNISSLVSGPPKQREYERRSLSGASNRSIESINAFIRTPPDQMRSASGMSNRSSGTPPLRRADRSVSSDLRSANRMSEAKKRAKHPEAEAETEVDTSIPPASSSTIHDDSTKEDKSKGRRVREMADVFVLELESRNDRLLADNTQLHEAKARAERDLEDAAHHLEQEVASYRDSIETREAWLRQKDTELGQLKETIESLQGQVTHLTEVNEGLHASSRGLNEYQQRYGQLEEEHATAHQQWQQSTRELEDLRQQHAQLSTGMEDIIRHEVTTAVKEKNLELHRIQSELAAAKDQIRTLQAQILAQAKRSDDVLVDRDEDYFDTQCQSLCQHVQQWVLRFSKFSDSRACYLASEIRDEKVVDRMENAILDGSDVDTYMADRVKRRDVFMSMVMTMTWEFIFTRYLFGADREQRQKLKSLEKTLSESAERAAVHRWRATTLNLLSKREAFRRQRATDTEAVMHTIYETLATILPPPGHLVAQVQASLSKVLSLAVDLSIEMRTQRFEYVMLPPLQPEYDTNGDLARKVFFNAALMHERGGGGDGTSDEELEAREAVVRMVLFPLVVRKGDGGGDGEEGVEEIVVCPAQVLTAEVMGRGKGGRVRVVSAQGSVADVGMGNMF